MRNTLLIVFLFVFALGGAQKHTDSLKRKAFEKTVVAYWDSVFLNPETALTLIQQNILLAEKLKSDIGLSISFLQYATLKEISGNYPEALRYKLESLRAAERTGNFYWETWPLISLGELYREIGDFDAAFRYLWRAKSLIAKNWKPVFNPDVLEDVLFPYFRTYMNLAQTHARFNKTDSASYYAKQLYDGLMKIYGKVDNPEILSTMGDIYSKLGRYRESLSFYRRGALLAFEKTRKTELRLNYLGLAKLYTIVGKYDSSIFYSNKILELIKGGRNMKGSMEAYILLSTAFKQKGISDSVAKYLDLTIATKDSMFGQQKMMQFQSVAFNEQLRQREIKVEQEKYAAKVRNYVFMGGIGTLLLVTGILYRANSQKQRAKKKVELAYDQLKSTQAQLIQSEKMASLGELTAGIAHEIQNPLNFVNNFSEVINELIDEMELELNNGNKDEAMSIARDIKENGKKVNHHGKRADAIVKEMLQHSRPNSSTKELTDINNLADKFLRLTYQGVRAKDKAFNATLLTDFDQSIEKINIIPQDIGRVFLNLYNNAFYAIAERQKQQPEGYEPVVSVRTKKCGNHVEISIKDNGNGITQEIKDKIFQPFFTTKPPGQGTGMGLSLSHDIIKAHGGEIRVETDSDGSDFIIRLPLNLLADKQTGDQ